MIFSHHEFVGYGNAVLSVGGIGTGCVVVANCGGVVIGTTGGTTTGGTTTGGTTGGTMIGGTMIGGVMG